MTIVNSSVISALLTEEVTLIFYEISVMTYVKGI